MSENAFFGEEHEDFPEEHTKKICADLKGVCDIEGGFEEACNECVNHERSEYPPENKSALRTVIREAFEIVFHICLRSVFVMFFEYITYFLFCHSFLTNFCSTINIL